MSAITVEKEATGTKVLAKVNGYGEFPKNATLGQKLYFYEGAVEALNKTKQEGVARPLAAFVGYDDYYRDGVDVDSDFWEGGRARVVVGGKNGKPELLTDEKGKIVEVSAVEKAEEAAKKQGKELAGSDVVLPATNFLEQNRDQILAFSSAGAEKLGVERFREGYYLAEAKQSKTAGSLAEELKTELSEVRAQRASAKEEYEQKDKGLAETEKKLLEAIPKAEKAEQEKAEAEGKAKSSEAEIKAIMAGLGRSA